MSGEHPAVALLRGCREAGANVARERRRLSFWDDRHSPTLWRDRLRQADEPLARYLRHLKKQASLPDEVAERAELGELARVLGEILPGRRSSPRAADLLTALREEKLLAELPVAELWLGSLAATDSNFSAFLSRLPASFEVAGLASHDRHYGGIATFRVRATGEEYFVKRSGRFGERLFRAAHRAVFDSDRGLIASHLATHRRVRRIPRDSEIKNTHFYSLGRQLALAWVLGVGDLHSENAVPSEGEMVFVDLECCFQKVPESELTLLSPPQRVLRTGLASTNLLPAGQAYVQRHFQRDISMLRSLLQAAGRPHDGAVAEVVRGFEWAVRQIARRANPLRQGVSRYASCMFRCILRPTEMYADLLSDLTAPSSLAGFEGFADKLARLMLTVSGSEVLQTGIASEIAQLLLGDIPTFFIKPNTLQLYDWTGTALGKIFEEPPIAEFERRLEQLASEEGRKAMERELLKFLAPLSAPSKVSVADFPSHMGQVAYGRGIGAGFLVHRPLPDGGAVIADIGIDLYGGLAGVVFAGAAASRAGIEGPVPDIKEAVELLRQKTRDLGDGVPVGGFAGLGGVLYVLEFLHRCCGIELRVEIQRVAEAIEREIEYAKDFDGMYGMAGLALAYRVANKRSHEGLWPKIRKQLLQVSSAIDAQIIGKGYAHGLSGVLQALSVPEVRDSETDRIADSLIRAFKPDEVALAADSSGDGRWCDGAYGIAAALRLAAANGLKIPADVMESYERSCKTPLHGPELADFCLCHGALGKTLLLDMLGVVSASPPRIGDMPVWDVNPSLFTGLFGYVYFLARKRRPDRVPNVLFLEPF